MYCKFSIVQFTTLSFLQQQSKGSNAITVSSTQGQQHQVEMMPKKRGRPIKNEPKSKTQMVITSTENIPCFSPQISFEQEKRKKQSCTAWLRNCKPKTVHTPPCECTTNTIQMDNCLPQSPHTCERRMEVTPSENTSIKRRIIRSSISIKELLN